MPRIYRYEFDSEKKFPQELSVCPIDDVETCKGSLKLSLPQILNRSSSSLTAKDVKKDVHITEHLLSVEELSLKLSTDARIGLTEAEAEFRLKRDGPNAFTPPKQEPEWLKFLKNFASGFALLLWFCVLGTLVVNFFQPATKNVSVTYHYNKMLSC